MLWLSSKHIRNNPQVWQMCTMCADVTREDTEGFYEPLLASWWWPTSVQKAGCIPGTFLSVPLHRVGLGFDRVSSPLPRQKIESEW